MAECPEEGGLWVNLVCSASHLKVNTFYSKYDPINHLFGLSLNHVEGWRLGRFAHSHFLPPKHQLQGEDRSGCHSNLLVEVISATDFLQNIIIFRVNTSTQLRRLEKSSWEKLMAFASFVSCIKGKEGVDVATWRVSRQVQVPWSLRPITTDTLQSVELPERLSLGR